ncbi:MAG: MauE/DoxX family redox-associated membrane protein [Pirellulaceae bacterium]
MSPAEKHTRRLAWLFRLPFFLFPVFLLVVSAALKTHVLLAVPFPEFFIGGSFLLTLWVVWMEFFLAAWLASRWRSRWAKLAAVVVFTIFALISIFKLTQGATNCGCFGAFQTSPWLSLALDVAAITCLSFNFSYEQNSSRRFVATIFALAALICFVQIALVIRFSPLLKSGEIDFDGYGGIAFLEPSKWEGKKFPLIRWLENGDQLREGSWTVFLLISECELCHEVQKTLPITTDEVRVAIVEFSPHSELRTEERVDAVYFQIDDEKKWFVAAPVRLEVRNGIVNSVTTRDEIKSSLGK